MTVAENEIHKTIKQNITPVVEDYLKAIYSLRQTGESVRTAALAARLNVKPPTVTAMLKTLADLNLIRYEPYRGVELTDAGEQIALEVVRHHRLIELYLVEALGFSWDEVHEEAEVLEHFISEKLEARITDYLGNPTHDPHGDPIPNLDGTLPDTTTTTLADFSPAVREIRVVRVRDQNADRLCYLAEIGLVPKTTIKIVAVEPFDGPVTIQIGKKKIALDRQLARLILVEETKG